MAFKHCPVPMSQAALVSYRWATPLPALGAKGGFAAVDATAGGSLAMTIGETSEPHVFANAVNGRNSIAQTVWGYGMDGGPITYPGPMILAQRGKPLDVAFANSLPVATYQPKAAGGGVAFPSGMRDGDYPFVEPPPDLAPAGMGAGGMGRYSAGHATVHLHGADLAWESDGYPMRLPQGAQNPRGLPTVIAPGETRMYSYPNRQRGGGLLWYHDHLMDSTARNVYAGLAGAYPLLAPAEIAAMEAGRLPGGNYHLPLILQDRSFTEDGELLYADAQFLSGYLARPASADRKARRDWVQTNGPMTEFKGHALTVNGKVWPTLEVEPRPYRFRVLNGCNSRFLVLRLSREKPAPAPGGADCLRVGDDGPLGCAASLYQIGSDGGLFAEPVPLTGLGPASTAGYLVLAPGERADVLIDFSGIDFGTSTERRVYLTNHSEEGNGLGISGDNLDRFASPDPFELLGNLLQFTVKTTCTADPYPTKIVDLGRGPAFIWNQASTPHVTIASILRAIVDDENKAFGLELGGLKTRFDAQPKAEAVTRQFVIREFPNISMNAADEAYAYATSPHPVSGRRWPPGRRGWSAITFRSDIRHTRKAGYLWGGSMEGRTQSPGPAPHGLQWSPPLMGGPAFDPGNLADHYVGTPHVELWEFYNLSGDIHPIHLHLVNFEAWNRQRLADRPGHRYGDIADLTAAGVLTDMAPVDANENSGWKDTVRCNPGEVLRLLVQFRDHGGSVDPISNFVWHCHLIEHEDMGMMRPLDVANVGGH